MTPSPELADAPLPTPTPLFIQAQLHEPPHKQLQQINQQKEKTDHEHLPLQQELLKDYKEGKDEEGERETIARVEDQQQVPIVPPEEHQQQQHQQQQQLQQQKQQQEQQAQTKHASTTTISLGFMAPSPPRHPPLGTSGMHGHAPLTHIHSIQHDLDPDHPTSHKSSGPASSVASSWVFDKDGNARPRHGRRGRISKGFRAYLSSRVLLTVTLYL